MTVCPECGAEVSEGVLICSNCGHEFEGSDPTLMDVGEIYKSELEPLKNKIIEKYEIVDFLGKGGFSTVFKLRDKTLERYCALKVLDKKLISEKEVVERFKMEARLYARLEHPNIVRVYDVGFYNRVAYILMNFIEGENLKDYIKKHSPIELEEIIRISIDILSVIEHLHLNGIVHRDIKPANIMVQTADKKAILTDFGLAKSINLTHLTATGKIMGSPHYLAPEQAKGEGIDARTDIYSFGITLYEMATGAVPFSGETPVQVVLKHIKDSIPRPSKIYERIHPELEKIILKATRKKPADRYQSAAEIIEDIKNISKTGTKKKKNGRFSVRRAFLAAAALFLVIFVLYQFRQQLFPGKSENIIQNSKKQQTQEKQKDPYTSEKTKEEKIEGSQDLKKPAQTGGELKAGEKGKDKGSVASEKNKTKTALPPRYPVQIVSSPLGVNVFINNREIGKTPYKTTLPVGKYQLKLVRGSGAGAQTETREIQINSSGKTVTVNHEFNMQGTIEKINSDPWGNAYLDGKFLGVTPTDSIRIEEGDHTIKIEKNGYDTEIIPITVEAGKTIPLIHRKLKRITQKPALSPSTISLIHVIPYGTVSIDGQIIKINKGIKVNPGEHTISVSHPKFNFTDKFVVKEGEDIERIVINLSEGKMTITPKEGKK